MTAPLFLASRSPRRVQLLDQLGVACQALAVDVVEQPAPDEAPADYVCRLALAKARAGLAQVADVPGARVIGADTEVVLDGHIFGKPADAGQAQAMLAELSGRSHQVFTAVAVVGVDIGQAHTALCVSRVHFAPLDRAAIDTYIATGEPFGKAGGYAIQGRAAAFIRHLEGSFSGVMGLPLFETAQLLAAAGRR